jgi:sec-independent protein translocase protein TatB
MFGIGFSEIVLIALVAIIFIRPDDMPAALRRLGRAYGKIKKTIDEFTEFKDAFMKQVDELAKIEAEKTEPAEEKKAIEAKEPDKQAAPEPAAEQSSRPEGEPPPHAG